MTVQYVTRVTAEAEGLIPGLRVWDLTAYDEKGGKIAEVKKDMGNNNKKFRAFIEAVGAKGYVLTSDQINYISKKMLLDLPQIDNERIRSLTESAIGAAGGAVAGETGAKVAKDIAASLGI